MSNKEINITSAAGISRNFTLPKDSNIQLAKPKINSKQLFAVAKSILSMSYDFVKTTIGYPWFASRDLYNGEGSDAAFLILFFGFGYAGIVLALLAAVSGVNPFLICAFGLWCWGGPVFWFSRHFVFNPISRFIQDEFEKRYEKYFKE